MQRHGSGRYGHSLQYDPPKSFDDDRFLAMLRYTWDLVQEIENERLGRRFGLWDTKLDDPAGNFYDQLKDIHDGILACVMETNSGGVDVDRIIVVQGFRRLNQQLQKIIIDPLDQIFETVSSKDQPLPVQVDYDAYHDKLNDIARNAFEVFEKKLQRQFMIRRRHKTFKRKPSRSITAWRTMLQFQH
ncbi:hypothetical protein BGZ61DRAFT_522458 [Ilyonectria robusta]|uniref:uncharacterized protein n=1 Tax=Ilyonectria robusta TaxID=1079257 RepID=UPI001E8E5447|nr:uncharacterized protein BGZ61DRAFT_522458 [Ilyonectria robusta]KAH8666237.1 hypothetical protein BGZ61DRAFT_522458 [Ilyonectria robusta]